MAIDQELPGSVTASIAAGRAAREKLAADMKAASEAEEGRVSTLAELPEPEPVVEEKPEQPDEIARLTAELAKKSAAYDTLRGKYDAEIPALYKVVEELKLTVQGMKTVEPEKKTLTPPKKRVMVTEDEKKAYGDDMIDVIGRRAQEVIDETFGPELEELRSKLTAAETKLADVGKGVQTVREQTARDNCETYLDRHVPNWVEQDADPEFLTWLKEEDTFTGLPRLQLLGHARTAGQFARVSAIFKGYLTETGKTYGTPAKSPVEPTPQLNGKVKLDTLVAPATRQRNARAPDNQAPQAISRADIHTFYDALHRGKYAGREAEVDAIKQRIRAAVSSGNVTA